MSHTKAVSIILMVWSMLAWACMAQAADPVGRVLAASGAVSAESADGIRILKRRSPVYAGDTLVTGPGAAAQLRFSDGAMLALQADTRFRVDSYQYDPDNAAAGESVSSLLKGGFRTITGAIGKQDPSAYRVDTPVATIGVRGTNYEAVLGQELIVAAWQGVVVVSNDQGEIHLGQGADYNFARIGGRRIAPRGQLAPPPGLQGALPAAPPEVRAPAAAPQQPPQSQPQQQPGRAPVAQAPTHPAGPQNGTRPPAPLKPLPPPPLHLGMGVPLPPPPGMPAPLPGYNLQGDDLAVGGFTTLPPPDSTSSLPISDSPDLRLTATEKADLNYLGFALVSGPGIMNTLGGKATNGSSGSPVFAEVGVNPGQPGFNTLPFTKIVRQGNAPLFGPVSTAVIDGQHKIDWGVWNASPGNAVFIQNDPNDPSKITPVTRPVFWMSGNPTALNVAAARTGTVTYGGIASWPSHAIAVQGGGSGGLLDASNFRLQADVNFGTGAVTGNVQITPTGENWNIGFSGTMANGFMNATPGNFTGSVTSGAGTFGVDGDIGASLSGASGQALGGSFDFEAVGNPGIHAEGIFIVGECPGSC